MLHSLNNIAGTRLALGADHGSTLADAAQCLAQILGTADKRHLELMLVNMINIISRGKNLALINIVNLNSFQNLRLYKVADTALGHDRNGNRLLDALDHLRVAHAGYAACGADISRNPLQRHDSAGTCRLGNPCLLRSGNVHDDAALQHLCQLLVQLISILCFLLAHN